jgi:hypothetical protein
MKIADQVWIATLLLRLRAWYRNWRSALSHIVSESDSLLALAGSGKQLWKEEHADVYVRRLRESWK